MNRNSSRSSYYSHNSSANGLRESPVLGRNIQAAGSQLQQHRRGQCLTNGFSGVDGGDENNLDLFSKDRRSVSVAYSDEASDVSVKLGRLSVGSAKFARSGIEDLLSSTEGGKNDYDWLLTPPGTPLFPSSDGGESQPTSMARRTSSMARSTSTTKASRLSVSQSENYLSSRPTRSSSLTRPSVSSSQFSTYSSNKSSSILNTSSASVSSYTRPSSPNMRSASTARPSTPSARPIPSRSSTPTRARTAPTSSVVDKTRPSQNSRPSTPNSRMYNPTNSNAAATRSTSRPSTPTRRHLAPFVSPASGSSTSAGRVVSNGRISAPSSRPSSPSQRTRSPQQPIILPDFALDTPPNLRTTLPDRPLSAGRSRPGGAVTTKGNSETTAPVASSRRHSSPIVTRGRLAEPSGKSRALNHRNVTDINEPRRATHTSDFGTRKPVKSSLIAIESTGLGRTISKKSLDMAIRQMDVRNGTGSTRSPSGTALFPQSIKSATPKTQSVCSLSAPESINPGNAQHRDFAENGHVNWHTEIETGANDGHYRAKLSEFDVYESSRYDAILLKEDLKNTNWLHSIDDKSDQGSIFDNGFEPLPEPFGG